MMNRRVFPAAVAAITALGAILRIIPMARDPLWSDEALTGLIALHSPFDLVRYPLDPSPALFYWLQALFVPSEASAVVTRLPALLVGVLTIPAMAWVGTLLGGRKAGVAAALLSALSPILIDHSHEARAYALLVLMLAITLGMALRALGREARPRETAGFALAGTLSLLTHVVAVFVVWPVAAVLAWQGRRRGAAPGWMLAIALMGAAFIPEAIRIVRVSRRSPSFSWLQQPSPDAALGLYADVATGVAGWVGVAALALVAWLAWTRRDAMARAFRERPGAGLLLAIFLLEPLVLYAFGLVGKPLLMPRAALPMLVGLIPAVSLILTRNGKFQVPALVVTTAVLAGGLALEGLSRPKEDWGGAARTVLEERPDYLLICPQWQAPALLSALSAAGGWRPILLVDTSLGPTLVPQQGSWRTTFYRALYWDDTVNLRRRPPKAAEQVQLNPGSALALVGSCSDPGRMESWAKPARRQVVWRSSRPEPVANMTIERWTLEGSRTVRVAR